MYLYYKKRVTALIFRGYTNKIEIAIKVSTILQMFAYKITEQSIDCPSILEFKIGDCSRSTQSEMSTDPEICVCRFPVGVRRSRAVSVRFRLQLDRY